MDKSREMVIRTATPESLLLGAGSVVMGWAAATVHGNGELLPAILCLFFGAFMQLYNNWAHRYYDIKYKFGEYIDDGYDLSDSDIITTYALLKDISGGALVMAATVGLGLMCLAGWWTIAIGLIVFLCGWLNSHGNRPILRTRAALLLTFFVFGPLGVIGTGLVQSATGHTSTDFNSAFRDNMSWFDLGPAVLLSLPAGLMAVSAHLAHGFRKYHIDVDNNKKTLATTLGLRMSANIYLVNSFLVPLSYLPFWFFTKPAPPLIWLLLAPVLVCLFMISRYRLMIDSEDRPDKMIEAETSWAFLFLSVCTYILCLTTGIPNDSPLRIYG